MSERPVTLSGQSGTWGDVGDGWDDVAAGDACKRLSRAEAAALRASQRSISPWWVVGVQAAVGAAATLVGWWLTGRREVAWSMLYGAAAVVVPAAVLARGVTRRVARMTPLGSAVSLMLWEFVKIALALAMLLLAPKIVQPLSWPALLAALVLCMQVYWFALLRRAR